MSLNLTSFQSSVRDKLERLVSSSGMAINLSVEGENESFLHGFVHPLMIEVWIYEDELELKFPGKHRLLERPDFDSLQKMEQYFLSEVQALLDAARIGPE